MAQGHLQRTRRELGARSLAQPGQAQRSSEAGGCNKQSAVVRPTATTAVVEHNASDTRRYDAQFDPSDRG